jgi:hypothetical protein
MCSFLCESKTDLFWQEGYICAIMVDISATKVVEGLHFP